VRDQILARTRRILNENYSVLDGWLRSFGELFQWHEPECGAICLARYRHPMPAIELAERVLTSHDILLQPGEHFGLSHSVRLGYGNEQTALREALAEVKKGIGRLLMD
jgi:DNA-binding transcriptional MocR family regulator